MKTNQPNNFWSHDGMFFQTREAMEVFKARQRELQDQQHEDEMEKSINPHVDEIQYLNRRISQLEADIYKREEVIDGLSAKAKRFDMHKALLKESVAMNKKLEAKVKELEEYIADMDEVIYE